MNNRYNLIVLLCGLFLLGGCKKYLEVQPEASYTETQVYSNATAVQQALNGLYLNMASPLLYGANLSTTVIELLAQRYKPVYDLAGRRDLSVISDYQYQATNAQGIFDSIWRKSYFTILVTNEFLAKLENSINNKVISTDNANQLKGEALGIRAMIHLDLLRLYGPVYATGASSPAIPYYSQADARLQPILKASQVMDSIMSDLTKAATLLAKDPVITKGIAFNTDFYSGYRNQRLNYYAVKALIARANMWAGKKDDARNAALAVLNEGEKWFPWTESSVAKASQYPDRVFSSEVMFGLYNPDLYTNYNLYFSAAQYDGAIMAPDSLRLRNVFEDNGNDYRYLPTWKKDGKSYPTFFKYQDVATNLPWRFMQPLVRKSEMYYILAETETDPVKALGYLNTVTRAKGLAALPSTASIAIELRKEYQKEFWGEGQLFFYYKRIEATGLPSASLPYDWATVDPSYVVPLPLSETATR